MSDAEKPIVLLTRTVCDSHRVVDDLEMLGIASIVAPAISVEFIPSDYSKIKGGSNCALMFTSSNGVYALGRNSSSTDLLGRMSRGIFCIGETTSAAVHDLIDRVSDCSPNSVAAAGVYLADGTPSGLVELICSKLACGSAVVHLGGQRVRGWIGAQLTEAGYAYRHEIVYETFAVADLPEEAEKSISSGSIVAQLFYSRFTLESHARRCANLALDWQLIPAVCFSADIAKRATSLGCRYVSYPQTNTHEAMVAHVAEVLGV